MSKAYDELNHIHDNCGDFYSRNKDSSVIPLQPLLPAADGNTVYVSKELVDILEAALQAAIDGKDAQAAAFDALAIYRKAIGADR